MYRSNSPFVMPIQQLMHKAVGVGILYAMVVVGGVLEYGYNGGLAAVDGGLLVFEDDLETYI
jgi:hypothetical protein